MTIPQVNVSARNGSARFLRRKKTGERTECADLASRKALRNGGEWERSCDEADVKYHCHVAVPLCREARVRTSARRGGRNEARTPVSVTVGLRLTTRTKLRSFRSPNKAPMLKAALSMYWRPYVLGANHQRSDLRWRRSDSHAKDREQVSIDPLEERRFLLLRDWCGANVGSQHLPCFVACVELVYVGVFQVSFELPILLE